MLLEPDLMTNALCVGQDKLRTCAVRIPSFPFCPKKPLRFYYTPEELGAGLRKLDIEQMLIIFRKRLFADRNRAHFLIRQMSKRFRFLKLTGHPNFSHSFKPAPPGTTANSIRTANAWVSRPELGRRLTILGGLRTLAEMELES